MKLHRLALLTASSAALACAHPSLSGTPVPVDTVASGEATSAGFKPTGDVFFGPAGGAGRSVAYSDSRIVGPRANMTRAQNGQWAGNLAGKDLVLNVEPGRITGDGVDLLVARDGTTVDVQGMFGQRQVRMTLGPKGIQGTTNSSRCSFDLTLERAGVYRGGVSCRGAVDVATLHLTGEAAQVESSGLPQLVLALIDVLPS